MLAFFIFTFTMSFTPGPNTLMAMSEAAQKGLKKSWAYINGSSIGFIVNGLIVSLFTELFVHVPIAILILKITGSVYLLYLVWHLWTAKASNNEQKLATRPFLTGFLLQMTNIKVYLYFVTALSAFRVFNILSALIILIVIGVLGTILWALAGQLIQKLYQRHFHLINVILALLLVYSTVDLWL